MRMLRILVRVIGSPAYFSSHQSFSFLTCSKHALIDVDKVKSKSFTNLLFLGRAEIILDIECFPDFLRSLPLDHIGHSLACHI